MMINMMFVIRNNTVLANRRENYKASLGIESRVSKYPPNG